MGGVFDTKIINNECELDGAMCPVSTNQNDVDLLIPGCIEALFQEVVSKTSSLRKAVHATNAPNVYPSIKCGFFVEFLFLCS